MAATFLEQGYNVKALLGGVKAWKDAGYIDLVCE